MPMTDSSDSPKPAPGERPSKTQIKAELERVKQFCWRLVELTPGQLAKLELPPDLKAALDEARRLTSPPARNRQVMVACRYLQELDWQAICAELEDILHGRKVVTKPPTVSAETPLARSLLTGDDESLHALSDRFGREELKSLRQIVRHAQKAVQDGRPPEQAVKPIADWLARRSK